MEKTSVEASKFLENLADLSLHKAKERYRQVSQLLGRNSEVAKQIKAVVAEKQKVADAEALQNSMLARRARRQAISKAVVPLPHDQTLFRFQCTDHGNWTLLRATFQGLKPDPKYRFGCRYELPEQDDLGPEPSLCFKLLGTGEEEFYDIEFERDHIETVSLSYVPWKLTLDDSFLSELHSCYDLDVRRKLLATYLIEREESKGGDGRDIQWTLDKIVSLCHKAKADLSTSVFSRPRSSRQRCG